jgi:hypothetical protein
MLLLQTACSCVYAQDIEPPRYETEHIEPKILEIKNVKLFAWNKDGKNKKYVEVEAFREAHELRLIPSDSFDVTSEVVGGLDAAGSDYFLWTTVDFLVAPVRRAFEQMDDNKLASSVGWGQITEFHDLKATPIYFLRSGETRRIVVKEFDLRKVVTAFPVGDAGELWPWLLRVTVHIQDRSGKQLAVGERIVRLSPSSAREKSHYNDPFHTQ